MEKKKVSIWQEFKEFAFKGNVIDLAVGVMIGGAFGKIVTSVVNDLFMPLISLLTGNVGFENLYYAMDANQYASLAAAQEAGVATINFGLFLSTVLDFLLMAMCVFLIVKLLSKRRNRSHEQEEPPVPEAPKPVCPYCLTEIAKGATRCPHCTSLLEAQ